MKRLVTFFLLLTLAVASLIFFPTDQTDLSPRTSRQASRPSRTTPEFWDSAHVPDPGEAPPVIAIRPEDLGIITPTPLVDPQALIAKAVSENDLPAIQSAHQLFQRPSRQKQFPSIEPLDAYRDFLEEQEKKGRFQILDKNDEDGFWQYFTNDATHRFYNDEEGAKFMNTPWWMSDQPQQE
jgi:hypothetical protein